MQRPRTLTTIRRQRGITFLGWLFLLVPIAVVVYAGIRLTPIYLNYMRVARSLDQTASAFTSGGDRQSVFTALERHFEVDSIDFPDVKDVTIQRDGGSWVLEAKYEDVAPLFANLSLTVDFDKVVRTGGGGT